MLVYSIKKLFVAIFLFFLTTGVYAGAIKPTLVEITVNQKGQIDVEVRASIEALLTGINGRYKNTKYSPNAAKYAALRKMSEDDLSVEFKKFEREFLDSVKLALPNNEKVILNVINMKIPEPGYTKVPRISVINLQGSVGLSVESLTWYYPTTFADNGVRLRQVDEVKQKYHWSKWQWLKDNQASKPFSLTEIVARRRAVAIKP